MKKSIKKSIKASNGITLIALVVTIIVLLILAGIAINMVLGNNGILQRAMATKVITDTAQEEESANFTFTEVQIELAQGKEVNIDSFQRMIDGNFGVGNATGTIGGSNYIITVARTGTNYKMDSSGNITELDELPIDFNPGVLEGNGTNNDPYVINSIEDLVAVSYAVNTGENYYSGNVVILGRNLDFQENGSYANANSKYKYTSNTGCSPDENSTTTIKELMTNTDGNGFTPIGVGFSSDGFKGTFDGKGKSLTNLYINNGTGANGLFGHISTDITIKNLNLSNCNIKGYSHTGGIVGYNDAILNISRCSVNGNIESEAPTGGIVGQSNRALNISYCYVSGNVTAQSLTGGIVGNGSNLDIFSCHNEANILSKGTHAGGIVGLGSGIIDICYNTGNINSQSDGIGIGGIIGAVSSDSIVYDCYNTGDIGEETKNNVVGGIVGNGQQKNVEIINCYNNGIILSKGPAGGIIGGYTTSSIINCYNFNNVTSKASIAGGIIACGCGSDTLVDNCHNVGDITANTNSNCMCGGIAGFRATVTNSYNTGKVYGENEYTMGYITAQDTVNNTNKYKKQSPDARANGAVEFESEEEMNQTMDVEKFVEKMNRYNYLGEENIAGIDVWELENDMPVFLD